MKLQAYRTSILLGISFTILLSTFWFLPQLAFIIFLSLLLQLLLTPAVERLAQKIPRALSAALVLFGFLLLLVGALYIVSTAFIPTFNRFVIDFPAITSNLQASLAEESIFLGRESNTLWEEIRGIGIETLKSSLSLLLSLFSRAIDIVIILFVTFYLLKDGEKIKAYLAKLFPTSDYERVLALFNKILLALRIYITSQLTICLITGIIVFCYYTVRGIPYASVFAMVSGVAEFIPVLGPTVASVLGTMMTATVGSFIALQTLAFYLILTQINHNIIYPTLIGKSLNLHPVAIILGIILGGEVLGAPGMFLTVPFIVIVKLVIEDIFRESKMTSERLKNSRWLAKKHDENQRT